MTTMLSILSPDDNSYSLYPGKNIDPFWGVTYPIPELRGCFLIVHLATGILVGVSDSYDHAIVVANRLTKECSVEILVENNTAVFLDKFTRRMGLFLNAWKKEGILL